MNQKVERKYTVSITYIELGGVPVQQYCEPVGYSREPTETAITKLIAERFADVTAIKVEEQ